MIYVLTTYSVIAKKGLGKKCFQASFERIKTMLQSDPVDSGMEAVIIGPKDVSGVRGNLVNSTLRSRHEKVIVIYIYQTEDEEYLVDAKDIFRYKVEKPLPGDIETIVTEVLSSNDKTKIMDAMFGPNTNEDSQKNIIDTQIKEQKGTSEREDLNKAIEDEIIKCRNFKDWDVFKLPIKPEFLKFELIDENTQYSEALKIIDNQERQIANIFRDSGLSPDEKIKMIKEIGIDKSAQRAAANNILVDKFTKTMIEIIALAKNTIDNKLLSIQASIDQMTKASVMYSEKNKLEKLILERVDTQMKLLELSREVIEIHKTIDNSAEKIVEHFEENLPSENEYINEIMAPFKRYFIPQNSTFLANKLFNDLQSEKLIMGQLESKIMSTISLLFKLCESDSTIIDYQSKLIKLLSAQKVEDIVIVDTILKNSLRLYIGTSDVGRTSTCVTLAKVLSRRNNSLLIDLTGTSKFKDYGINPVSLDEFLQERIERHFVCVEGNALEIENINDFIGKLKLRLNYYPYINIILDISQEDVIKKLSDSALSINFISNCTTHNINLMKNYILKYDVENIARKIILIDPQIAVSEIVSQLGADMLMYKVITVPYLAQMRTCSLKKTNPADIEEVSVIFEDLFN